MRKKLAVTMGDAAGIGAEIIVRALAQKKIYETAVPVVIGDRAPLEDALRFTGIKELRLREISRPEEAQGVWGKIDFIDCGLLHAGEWKYKENQVNTGDASFQYVVKGIRFAMEGSCDAVVTGPISKEAIHMAGHPYSGHTEIFADYTHTKNYAMLLIGGGLRVIHVTTHVSMEDACRLITKDRVLETIRLAQKGLELLGIVQPRIGVAGFNAHCSENGLFGTQEEDAIGPAVKAAAAEGILAEGPVPPDTVFTKALGGMYDVVVAMYHDQGHIPIKLRGFQLDQASNTYTSMSGINCTVGLPIIRTSVDHGTAYGKAGEGRANEESMVEALETAAVMANNLEREKHRENEWSKF